MSQNSLPIDQNSYNYLDYVLPWRTHRLPNPSMVMPSSIIWIVWAICLLPFTLNLLGIDFASINLDLGVADLEKGNLADMLHQSLAGSFTHTILEWSAFCAAIFTVVLAFTYFWIQKDVTTPIIGLALFCSGIMDAFHTLAADRLIDAVADNTNLIPFTWAICRMANALLTITGIIILLVARPDKWKSNTFFVLVVTSFFGVIAYGIIQVCATYDVLPNTMFPEAIITRPWDVAPLILFVLAGLFLYPIFDHRYPTIFSHALIISSIPNIMTQLHMAFGSIALFDNNFNIAHFLKIIAYLVPLTGLICDYYYTQNNLNLVNVKLNESIREKEATAKSLMDSQNELKEKNNEIQQAFFDLKQTQAQLIQTEKMSSLGQLVAGVAHEINNPVNFIYGNVSHLKDHFADIMELLQLYEEQPLSQNSASTIEDFTEQIDLAYIKQDIPKILNSMKMGSERIRTIVLSLRNFSRLDEEGSKKVDLNEGMDNTLTILGNRLKNSVELVKIYDPKVEVDCYAAQLNQVWMNLISNAIDAMEQRQQLEADYHATLTITTKILGEGAQITIADNALGFDQTIKDKIFDPFFTTKPIGKGTGLGLSIAYQIIEKHQGTMEVDSIINQGTTFTIMLPIDHAQPI